MSGMLVFEAARRQDPSGVVRALKADCDPNRQVQYMAVSGTGSCSGTLVYMITSHGTVQACIGSTASTCTVCAWGW